MDISKVNPSLVEAMGDKGNLLEELRRRVADVEPIADEPDFFTNPETLMRYLKAREWNVDEAEKQLKETVEWRRTTKPREIDCKWCHERPGYHCMRQVGFDELQRPVIYSCFAQATHHKNSVEDSLAHVTYLVESAKLTMPPGIHNWVFIMDCTGMSLPACSPKLGYGVTQVLSAHYPERLGLVICINHNPVFQGVWRAIKVFLHPNTAAKVQLVRGKHKIRELFERHFSEEMVSWLMEEIQLNKQQPLSASQREFWRAPEDPDVHDPRGAPDYIRDHIANYASIKRDINTHRPHPNVVGSILGTLTDVVPASPTSVHQEARAQESENGSDENDEGLDEKANNVAFAEEYQIPKDATPLHM